MLTKDNQHHNRVRKHMADTDFGVTFLLVGGSAVSIADNLKVDGLVIEGITPTGDLAYVQSPHVLGYMLHNSAPLTFGMSDNLIPGTIEEAQEQEDEEFTRLYTALREAAAASKDKAVVAASEALAAHEQAMAAEAEGKGDAGQDS